MHRSCRKQRTENTAPLYTPAGTNITKELGNLGLAETQQTLVLNGLVAEVMLAAGVWSPRAAVPVVVAHCPPACWRRHPSVCSPGNFSW